jgi:hypothetical protein
LRFKPERPKKVFFYQAEFHHHIQKGLGFVTAQPQALNIAWLKLAKLDKLVVELDHPELVVLEPPVLLFDLLFPELPRGETQLPKEDELFIQLELFDWLFDQTQLELEEPFPKTFVVEEPREPEPIFKLLALAILLIVVRLFVLPVPILTEPPVLSLAWLLPVELEELTLLLKVALLLWEVVVLLLLWVVTLFLDLEPFPEILINPEEPLPQPQPETDAWLILAALVIWVLEVALPVLIETLPDPLLPLLLLLFQHPQLLFHQILPPDPPVLSFDELLPVEAVVATLLCILASFVWKSAVSLEDWVAATVFLEPDPFPAIVINPLPELQVLQPETSAILALALLKIPTLLPAPPVPIVTDPPVLSLAEFPPVETWELTLLEILASLFWTTVVLFDEDSVTELLEWEPLPEIVVSAKTDGAIAAMVKIAAAAVGSISLFILIIFHPLPNITGQSICPHSVNGFRME